MVISALKKVFRKPKYIVLSLCTSFLVFAFAVWLPNARLIVTIMGHPGISFSERVEIPITLLGSIVTNFTLLSALYTIVIAILFGIHVSMVVYMVREKIAFLRKSGLASGFLGIVSGILGMGCAACGSLLLTAGISLVGASAILSFLPFNGAEFGILGVLLLWISLYKIAKRIEFSNETCGVKG